MSPTNAEILQALGARPAQEPAGAPPSQPPDPSGRFAPQRPVQPLRGGSDAPPFISADPEGDHNRLLANLLDPNRRP